VPRRRRRRRPRSGRLPYSDGPKVSIHSIPLFFLMCPLSETLNAPRCCWCSPISPKVPTYQPGHRTSADAYRKFATPPGSWAPVPRHPSRRRRRPAARRRLVPAAAGLPLPRASSPSCGSAARTPTEESCNVCPEILASRSSSDCCISISLFCSCCYCFFPIGQYSVQMKY
jgi:hypothetical protein